MELNEENIESFIRKNKDKFPTYKPSIKHKNKFLRRLAFRFKLIISIVPYLIRLFIITIIIFIFSIWVWNDAIRKDRNEITLKEKIITTYQKIINN